MVREYFRKQRFEISSRSTKQTKDDYYYLTPSREQLYKDQKAQAKLTYSILSNIKNLQRDPGDSGQIISEKNAEDMLPLWEK